MRTTVLTLALVAIISLPALAGRATDRLDPVQADLQARTDVLTGELDQDDADP